MKNQKFNTRSLSVSQEFNLRQKRGSNLTQVRDILKPRVVLSDMLDAFELVKKRRCIKSPTKTKIYEFILTHSDDPMKDWREQFK